MIAIVDYGMGNLASVAKAFSFLGARAKVTSDPKRVARSEAVVFPGVGAFGPAMQELKKRRLIDPIVGSIRHGKPFLGLCLGLQLLFEESEESAGVKGLGVLPGRVLRLPARRGLKIPHMGWNQIQMVGGRWSVVDCFSIENQKSKIFNPLLKGIPDGAFMYFVHSFAADPEDKEMICAMTEYGGPFPSVISNHRHLWATQFHPEKSQRWGLMLLKNFLNEVGSC